MPARQQACAHRLVLGRLLDRSGDPLHAASCPELQKQVSALTAALGCLGVTEAARQHGRPRAQPVVGAVVEIDEASLPFRTKDDPPTGGHGRSHDGTCSSSAPLNSGTESSQAACGWPKSPPSRRNRRRSPPRENRYRLVRLRCRSPPIDNVHVVGKTAAHLVLPWIHQVLLQPAKDGREASTTGCVGKHLQAYLEEFAFMLQPPQIPATLLSGRSLFRLATNAEPLRLQHVDRTGSHVHGSGTGDSRTGTWCRRQDLNLHTSGES